MTWIEKIVGLFAVLCTALIVAALFASAKRQNMFQRETFELYTYLDKGYGLKNGAEVLIRDVEVGVVTDVTMVREGQGDQHATHAGRPVRVTLRLDRDFPDFVTTRTRVRVVRPLIGSAHIQLVDDGKSKEKIARHSTLDPVEEKAESLEEKLAKIKDDVEAVRREGVETLRDLQGAIANVRVLTDEVVQGKGVLGGLIVDDALARTVSASLTSLSATVAAVSSTAQNAKQASEGLPKVTAEVQSLITDARASVKRLDETLAPLPKVVASAERALRDVEVMVANLRDASAGSPEVMRKIDQGFEETTRTMQSAQRSFFLRGNLPERAAPPREAEALPRGAGGR